MLVVWSATYLARQSGAELATPFSPMGDFALEGMVLAITWLVSVVTACAAMLTGAVVVRVPEEAATQPTPVARRPVGATCYWGTDCK
jgi:hypothetical protein